MIVSPGSAAFMAFWMDSPGPTTLFAACAEPIAVASATPLATNRVRAMVDNNTMVRLIKRPPLCSRGAKEERCQTPAPLRNEGSILLCEGSVCAPWHKARQSTKEAPNFRELRYGEVRRIPIPRTSVNKGKMKEGRDLKDSTLPLLSPASAAGLISILRMEMEADLPKSSAGCPVAVAHARRQCRPRSHNRLQPHLSCPQTPSLCHRRKRLGPWLQDRCR